MSALGQKQTCAAHKPTSALCQYRTLRDLFDHLVGAARQGQWNGYAERLGGLKIYDQFDFGNVLDRQVGGLFALEDTAGVDASPTERIRK